ncbi:MAG: cell wall metabolism sensor histidine kinase WalK [Chlamydiales bacterium]|nr:cell wall metabolism sensor histidine kinase WalK [Chlamydiales bacterium]
MNLTFRKKLFLSLFVLFFTFIAIIFPFAHLPIITLFQKALFIQTTSFSRKLKEMSTKEDMIHFLKEKEYTFFIRVTVLDEAGSVFYDSHAEKILGKQYDSDFVTRHPVIAMALEEGSAYKEAYSELFKQRLAYTAVTFSAKDGKRYIVRTAYPIRYIEDMIGFFELALVFLSSFLLFLFSLMTWALTHYLSSPIHKIISVISPYHQGKIDDLSKISLDSEQFSGEFGKLADTLQQLSKKVQEQMKHTELEKARRETILDALVEGVVAIGADKKIYYANVAAGNMLGEPALQLSNKYFHEINEPDCEKLIKQAIECREIVSEAIHLRHKPDSYIKSIIVPMEHSNEVVMILQDHTDYYKTIEMKKDFIANASHELKTPITIIRGYSETLRDYKDLDSNTVDGITEKIISTSNRMNRLIQDLLLLSDSESIANYNLSKVDLNHLVKLCIQDIKTLHPERTLKSDFLDETFYVNLDRELFKVAIMNLLKNAVRYSEAGTIVTIQITRNEQHIELKVSDQGKGIPEADQPYIFDRFYTVDKSHSRKMGGSGLGLSITRAIVEKHRGSIKLESKEKVGTSFIITLTESKEEGLHEY